MSFFFFQAEDGIRDLTVTGVQTCALPISFLKAIRAESDAIVNITTGGSPHMTVPERMRPVTEFQPELASLNMGSMRSEEHTSELQSQSNLVCRLLLEKKKRYNNKKTIMSD